MLFRSNDTATTEIYTPLYTLSLHDALPISVAAFSGFAGPAGVWAVDALAVGVPFLVMAGITLVRGRS